MVLSAVKAMWLGSFGSAMRLARVRFLPS
jgi:hypothetical protein